MKFEDLQETKKVQNGNCSKWDILTCSPWCGWQSQNTGSDSFNATQPCFALNVFSLWGRLSVEVSLQADSPWATDDMRQESRRFLCLLNQLKKSVKICRIPFYFVQLTLIIMSKPWVFLWGPAVRAPNAPVTVFMNKKQHNNVKSLMKDFQTEQRVGTLFNILHTVL